VSDESRERRKNSIEKKGRSKQTNPNTDIFIAAPLLKIIRR